MSHCKKTDSDYLLQTAKAGLELIAVIDGMSDLDLINRLREVKARCSHISDQYAAVSNSLKHIV